MPNYCHCGRSEMMPYCDGSHDGRFADRQGPAPGTVADVPPKPTPAAPEPAPTAPSRGWFARLFGRG